jgi:hypothetical protein
MIPVSRLLTVRIESWRLIVEKRSRLRLTMGGRAHGRPALIGLALCGLLLLTLGSQLWGPTFTVELTLDMAVTTSVDGGQVFIQTESGYSEGHSIRLQLVPDGSRHKYDVKIRGDLWARHLRFDPGAAPGEIRIYGYELTSGDGLFVYQPSELTNKILPLNQLEDLSVEHGIASMKSVGADPQFGIKIPFKIFRWLVYKTALGVLLSLAGISLLIVSYRIWKKQAKLEARAEIRKSLLAWAALMFLAAHLALTVPGAGCDDLACSVRGFRFGSQIFLAGIFCACIGAAFLRVICGRTDEQKRTPRFFFSLVVGQAFLVLYVYLRSAQNFYFYNLPITGFDFALLVAIAAAYLCWRWRDTRSVSDAYERGSNWLLVELALFAALSMIVADRELPRFMMLSTDPDIHAFLAKQVERFGSIPRAQGYWGEDGFNYPAGSPALTYVWAKLSWLNVRNSLAALILLQTFLVATLIGESVIASRKGGISQYITVQTILLAVMGAGFLISFYDPFSHMEGGGRQMAFAYVAAIVIVLMRLYVHEIEKNRGGDWLLLLFLFVLAVLNPANAIFPVALITAFAVYETMRTRKIPWRVLIPACFVLVILLDPYFLSMVTGSSHGMDKLDVSPDLILKSKAQILAGWISSYTVMANWSWVPFLSFLPWQHYPNFGLIFASFVFFYYFLREQKWSLSGAAITGGTVLACLCLLALGLFWALQDDRRYYLLYPYFVMGLAYYKIVAVLFLVAMIVLSMMARQISKGWIVLVALCLICFVGLTMRLTQPMQFEPRERFCEEGQCVAADDVAVLEQLQSMMNSPEFLAAKSSGARILVPNAVVQMGRERWAFPVGSGRILPFFNTLPVAFYYLQADPSFTTDNYVSRVCEKFDRDWLLSEKIEYVLIPSQGNGACVAGLESLVKTDRVVIKVGGSYLIKLIPPKDQ